MNTISLLPFAAPRRPSPLPQAVRTPLACAVASALLALAGCAAPGTQREPLAMPDTPLIRAEVGRDDPAQLRMQRQAGEPAPQARDLGPLRVRTAVGPRENGAAPREANARVGAGATASTGMQADDVQADAAGDPAGTGNADGAGQRVELNFVDADLQAVVRALARFTGRNFVVDPRVKGQLTLVSEQPVTAQTAYAMLLGALRMQGFAVVEVGGISRVLPEADAKLQGIPVADGGSAPADSGLITRVFQLRYENAANLVPVLRPMISPNNPVNAYPNNNTLVVTDYADNMARIAQVIAGIDTPASLNADVIPIRYGVASDVAVLLGQLLDAQGSSDPGARVNVVADPRTNSVLVRASSPARAQLARDLVARLDNPDVRPGNLHVVYLRNAQAVKLAEVLRGALTGQAGGGQGGIDGTGLGQAGGGNPWSGGMLDEASPGLDASRAVRSDASGMDASSGASGRFGGGGSAASYGGAASGQSVAFSAGGATVQADPSTNTLLISAPEPLYRSLREVIDQLDQRRAQVLVESLIVEVSSENAAEFGIQWMAGADGLDGDGTAVIGGTNLGGSGLNLSPNTATTIDGLGAGLNLGVVKGTVEVLGQEIVNLGFLARALQGMSGTNILSTPNLLTLDNEEASIVVGRTVPFVTGSYVTNSGDGAGNPFQTIEREDVGLTLRIRPQISEGGTVKLDLYQEVSSIDEAATSAAGIITRKRALETSVLVDNGQIIVLGGLLEDAGGGGTQSVPILGDIPVLGALFRYDTRRRTKTNLMVFLRPHIVRNAQDSRRVSLDRYDYMRRVQDNVRPEPRWPLPDMDSPQLPPLAPDGQPAPTLDLRSENVGHTLRQAPPPTVTETQTRTVPQ